MESDIAFYGIITAVGVAIFTSLGAIWYRLGRSVARAELDVALGRIDDRFDRIEARFDGRFDHTDDRFDRIEARFDDRFDRTDDRFDRTDELIISTANQLRAEMVANRAEMRQEMRQLVVDLTQAIANHRHDPDSRVSVMMVSEPQSGYETNRPAQSGNGEGVSPIV